MVPVLARSRLAPVGPQQAPPRRCSRRRLTKRQCRPHDGVKVLQDERRRAQFILGLQIWKRRRIATSQATTATASARTRTKGAAGIDVTQVLTATMRRHPVGVSTWDPTSSTRTTTAMRGTVSAPRPVRRYSSRQPVEFRYLFLDGVVGDGARCAVQRGGLVYGAFG